MESVAEIRGLKKYFGDKLVLDIPELTLYRGLRYALIGPNGSGKTTLLRILAGIFPPDEGSVSVNAASVAYMPQKPYAFKLSVLRNVELAVKSKNSRDHALKALEKVGLHDLHTRRGDSLSGGETQRMAFARVLADKHDFLLLDEPSSSADIASQVKMVEALSEYIAESPCTLFFSTHLPSQAASLADLLIILDNGRIAEMGSSEQVLYSPQSDGARLFLSHWSLKGHKNGGQNVQS